MFTGSKNMEQGEESIVPRADLHCHLLPAWDDGPETLEEALAMARRAGEAGIERIAVTPHASQASFSLPYERAREIPSAVIELQRAARAAGLGVEFVSGAELLLSPELVARVPVEPWLTIGGQGSYLLVEPPSDRWPSYADQVLFQLSLRQITAIICHPERLRDVQRDPGVLRGVVSRGALVQITAGSLAEAADKRTRHCARQLLEAGLASLVASDAHSTRDVLPGEVESVVRSVVGESQARRVLLDNPRLVLSGRRGQEAQT